MLRGEVWIGAWPNDPKKKGRPLLIVSNNYRNATESIFDVVVVKLTSLHRADQSKKPTNPVEDYVLTFKKPTIIRCGSIYSVEKSLLKSKIAQLSHEQMRDVDARLITVLDLN